MKQLVYKSEAHIEFNRELSNHHPMLMSKIAREIIGVTETDIESVIIGTVAAEFNIIMDGLYSKEQLDRMYDILIHKLKDRRKIIIRVNSNKKVH